LIRACLHRDASLQRGWVWFPDSIPPGARSGFAALQSEVIPIFADFLSLVLKRFFASRGIERQRLLGPRASSRVGRQWSLLWPSLTKWRGSHGRFSRGVMSIERLRSRHK